MKNKMRKLMLLALSTTFFSCAYAPPVSVGNDLVVVPVNDTFLFGALKKVYVCKATAKGLSSCKTNESP